MAKQVVKNRFDLRPMVKSREQLGGYVQKLRSHILGHLVVNDCKGSYKCITPQLFYGKVSFIYLFQYYT